MSDEIVGVPGVVRLGQLPLTKGTFSQNKSLTFLKICQVHVKGECSGNFVFQMSVTLSKIKYHFIHFLNYLRTRKEPWHISYPLNLPLRFLLLYLQIQKIRCNLVLHKNSPQPTSFLTLMKITCFSTLWEGTSQEGYFTK